MNYSEIIQQLNNASGFDLYRLKQALGKMLDDPRYIAEVKKRVRVGDAIRYFSARHNKEIQANVIKFNPTQIEVMHLDDGEHWLIPYTSVNLYQVDARIHENNKKGLTRNEVAIGDRVGFVGSRDGIERYGEVIRLNPKTITMLVGDVQWRVGYTLLFKIIGETMEQLTVLDPA